MAELKISYDELRKNKIFLATPMYGGMCAGMFTKSIADLSALCTHIGVPIQFYFLFNESLITRARNYCSDEFMRSDCTHLLFIDSDIGFNPHDVLAMIAMMSQPGNEYDVMGAPYPKKCISWEKIAHAVKLGFADNNPNDLEKYVGDYVFNPKAGSTTIKIDEPCEVLEIGTGFMMIKRAAMEKFAKDYAHHSYRPDHVRTAAFDGSREIIQFFQAEIDQIDWKKAYESIIADIQSGTLSVGDLPDALRELQEENAKYSKRYLSEDYLFCQQSQRIGLKIWFCPWMKLQHVGTYVFGGSLADLAAIGAAATADVGALKQTNGLVAGG